MHLVNIQCFSEKHGFGQAKYACSSIELTDAYFALRVELLKNLISITGDFIIFLRKCT